MSKVSIIGSGFSGLASATFLAQQGIDVTVFEKNDEIGGRARVFQESGLLLIWGQAGIGCQTFSKSTLISLANQLKISTI